MPTEESSLARALKALLSVGDVTIYPETEYTAGFLPVRGYRLVVNSSVVLDGEHARAVRDACGIAIDDSSEIGVQGLGK